MAARSSLTAKQSVDPTTGRPMIESLLAYREAPPPKPKPKPKRLSHPLPWRETPAQKAKMDALRKEMADAAEARKLQEQLATHGDPYSKQRLELPARSTGANAAATNSPCKTMGTVKVVAEFRPPVNPRDLPPEAHEHINIKPIGGNPKPKDGRRAPIVHPYSLDMNSDEEYDCVRAAVKQRPKSSPVKASRQQLEEQYNVLGAKIEKRPPPAPVVPEPDPREHEHFAKVMQRTKLVQMVRAEREHAEQEKINSIAGGHLDPTRHVDIFGRVRDYVPKESAQNPIKKNMFVGDREPLRLFGGDGPPVPAAKKAADGARAGLPTYISSPPPAAAPQILEDAQRGGGKGSLDVADPFAIPGTKVPPNAAAQAQHATFYASPLYKTIIFKSKGWGIRTLRHALRDADGDGDGVLSAFELSTALRKFGFDFDPVQVNTLIGLAPAKSTQRVGKPTAKAGDSASGAAPAEKSVFIPVLMDVLRRELSSRRKMIINAAFKEACASAGKSVEHGITLDELESVMAFNAHPSFQPHIRGSMREVITEFNRAWGAKKSRNSVIGAEEFLNYFHDVSASYLGDAEFCKMMKGVFNLGK